MSSSEAAAVVGIPSPIVPPPTTPNTSSHLRRRGEGLIAGGVAGAFAKTCTAPFERVKILCQTGQAATPITAATRVYSSEGLLGFWKGNGVSVLRIFPSRGVLFMCSDIYKDLLRYGTLMHPHSHDDTIKPKALSSWQYVAAGSLSGVTAVAATYPLDLVRGRLSGTFAQNSPYKGMFQTFSLTVREEGFRALYRGIDTSLIGALPYEGIRFGVYDSLKAHYVTEDSPLYMNVACGAAAGLTATIAVYPNDTVRRRMQVLHKSKPAGAAAAGAPSSEGMYRNGFDCYRSLYRQHGMRVFYRGMSANLARAAPSAALQFTAFELIKREFAETRANGARANGSAKH